MQVGVDLAKALENKRVFIVDDDEITRAALQFMLQDEFEAHEVSGIDLVFERARKQSPDLVILAEALVKMGGADLLQRMRREAASAKVLVVVEATDLDFGRECIGLGAHGFIAKPLRIEFVRQKVNMLLGRSKGGVTIPLTVL